MDQAVSADAPTTTTTTSPVGSLSAGDLAELMASFNDVTAKLENTHIQLKGEVSRLNSELAHANEALQRSKRLAALGEMAAGISHEIRNPLGSIRLYTRMLREDLVAMPEQCEIVDKIGRAVTGLDQIVGDVLVFSREIRARQIVFDSETVLGDACDACALELEGIEHRIEIEPGCSDALGDPSLLHQALVNLIRNGAQATKDNGGRRMCIGACRDEGDGFVFWVRDDGGGIEEGVLERMFNPFFTTRAVGTGLGLSIVHRIVDAHGGTIQVKNNTDDSGSMRGATVSLVLPDRGLKELPGDGRGQIVVRAGRMTQPREDEPRAQRDNS